jgi:hypothetical protein
MSTDPQLTYSVGGPNSNFKDLASIDTTTLNQGGVSVLVYPGEYAALTDAVLNNISFRGIGHQDEIKINGDTTIANTSTGTVTFSNMRFVGSDAAATSNTFCVEKLGIGSTPLHFQNCVFSNAEAAVRSHTSRTLGTGTKVVKMEYCHSVATNTGIHMNADIEAAFTAFQTGKQYCVPLSGSAPATTATIRSCVGGANVGNMTETVEAAIS